MKVCFDSAPTIKDTVYLIISKVFLRIAILLVNCKFLFRFDSNCDPTSGGIISNKNCSGRI